MKHSSRHFFFEVTPISTTNFIGTLPTFIDIGSNLNSADLGEDNIVDQMLQGFTVVESEAKRAVVLGTICSRFQYNLLTSLLCLGFPSNNLTRYCVTVGDDTWGKLFPSQFHYSELFDSFNTNDLHTVDDGIEVNMWKYLLPKNKDGGSCDSSADSRRAASLQQDWILMVTHFLGVDHIGHSHSAFHPLMGERLERFARCSCSVFYLSPTILCPFDT